MGRRLAISVLVVLAIAIGLLIARPWHTPMPECDVVLRPGHSIQAAIDAAEEGDVICLAQGQWTETILIDRPLTLMGRGVERTIIDVGMAFRPAVEVSSRGTDPIAVRLEGLTISGAGGGSAVEVSGDAVVQMSDCLISGRWYGLRAAGLATVTLSDCKITGSTLRAVVLRDAARASISMSAISGNTGLGVWVSDSAEGTFVDCQISENGEHGFWLLDDARVELSDCIVEKNRGHGLWLTAGSTAQLDSTDISDNWDQGIWAGDSVTVELTDSKVLSNWHGIQLADGSGATIKGSTIAQNRFDGLRIEHSAHAAVSGSAISRNGRGVGITGEAQATIRDCLVEKNSGYGVYSWSRGEVTGEGNEFRDNKMDLGGNLPGVLRAPLKEPQQSVVTWPHERYASLQEAVDALLPGGRLLLEPGSYTIALTIGNDLSIEAGDGEVLLEAKNADFPAFSLVDGADLHLEGVTISGGSTGLCLSAGARAVVAGCTISGNTEGVNLSYSSAAEIVESCIKDNERCGVFVGGSAQATITGCSIFDGERYAVLVSESARVAIIDSTVTTSGWEAGIIARGSCQVVLEDNTIVDNRGFGVALFERPCFPGTWWVFRGHISGSGNTFESNQRGDVCPPELQFLATTEGGELDRRP